jgi:ribosomal-protein-alanine N-acetyltransferase
MISYLQRWFTREPAFDVATVRDAAGIAHLHTSGFRRGWSEHEVEQLLIERNVLTQRATIGRHLVGFVMSRMAADEAEILSIAILPARRSRGLAGRLLRLHLGRLAGLGMRVVFLEVDPDNQPAIRLYRRAGFQEVAQRPNYYAKGAMTSPAIVLRRDLC